MVIGKAAFGSPHKNRHIVGIDGRVFSTEAADRGMGRYVRALIDYFHTSGHVICLILYANSRLAEDDPLLTKCSFSHCINIVPNQFGKDDIHISSYEIEKAARDFNFSIYVDATPFILPARFDITHCATLCIAYDLIPLRYPSYYLRSPVLVECYHNSLDRLRKADGVITISATVKEHLVRYLGLDRERITVIYPNLSPEYQVPCASDKTLRHNIFSILGSHRSKNTTQALALLKQASEIAGEPVNITTPTKDQYKAIKQITSTGLFNLDCAITEAEKLRLQMNSKLVAHLSVDEGFGIPFLEALFLEAKVFAIDIPMNREILVTGGDFAGACFLHPSQSSMLDEASFQQFMAAPARSEYYSKLRSFFKSHWEQVPRILTKACEDAVSRFSAWRNDMAVRVVSNTPANFCGVADYSSAIPAGVDKQLLFYTADTNAKKLPAYPNVRIKSYKSFALDNPDFDNPVIYNLAISDSLGFGVELLQKFGKASDIVVAHDLVYLFGLVYYFYCSGKFSELFTTYTIGLDSALIPRIQAATAGGLTNLENFMPIEQAFSSAWLREKGSHLISHSPLVEKCRGEEIGINTTFVSSIKYIPMGIDDRAIPQLVRAAQSWRRSHGIQEHDVLIGAFGSIVKVKYLVEIAEGIAAYIEKTRNITAISRRIFFLLSGKIVDQETFGQINKQFMAKDLKDRLIFEKSHDEMDFDTLLVAADIVVACRKQERVHMSHALVRELSLGRPIITNCQSGFGLDNELVLNENGISASLEIVLDTIMRTPEMLRSLSIKAREKFEADHRIENMVTNFLLTSTSSCGESGR